MRYSFKVGLIRCYKSFLADSDETPQMSDGTLLTKINLPACVQAGICLSWGKVSHSGTWAHRSPLDKTNFNCFQHLIIFYQIITMIYRIWLSQYSRHNKLEIYSFIEWDLMKNILQHFRAPSAHSINILYFKCIFNNWLIYLPFLWDQKFWSTK